MKKSILFFAFLIACLYASAQTFGIRGGLNVSSQRWEGAGNSPKSITGAHVGLFLNLGEREVISNQFEVSFSQFGFKGSDAFPGLESQKLNYLKIGSAFKFHLVPEMNLHIGPELGFQLNDNEDTSDFARSTDLGIIVGAEFFPVKNIGAGARYYIGLQNFGNALKQFNKAFQFSIIYLFNSKQLDAVGH